MAHIHHGIFLRDRFNDNGIVPSTGGIVWSSPDIMPQRRISNNPTSDFGDFSKRYQTEVEFGKENYIYIRCKNLAHEERTAIVNCYWAPSDLLVHPNIWLQNQLQTTKGHNSLLIPHIPSQQQAVGELPFVIAPPKADYNYWSACLIAIVMDEENPRNIPLEDSITSYTTWVQDHANVALNNLRIVNREPDSSYSFVTRLTNPEPERNTFQISTTLQNCDLGTGIYVALKGLDITFEKSEVTTRYDRSLDLTVVIPQGTYLLEVQVTAPGNALLPNDLEIYIIASAPGHPNIGGVNVVLEPNQPFSQVNNDTPG